MIYFIQAGQSGPIKIGTAENVSERLDTLQTAHYETLYLIGTRDGGREQEALIHKDLADFRLNGEWFKPVPEVLEYISDRIQLLEIPDGYFTALQVTSILRINQRTLSRWIARGQIEAAYYDKQTLIHRSQLEKFGLKIQNAPA